MKTLTTVQKERRERILASTRQQLSRMGYEGLNMRDLAVEAEVSTSTLYNLYQSKDTLILAALEDQLAGVAARVTSKNLQGLDRMLERARQVANQIVETPQFAEAMGKMLFNAEPSHPIVVALLSDSISGHKAELEEMARNGELREGVDREFVARSFASISWSVILMWMKGYIALHDFRKEYMRTTAAAILPWVTDDTAIRLRELIEGDS